MRLVNPEIRQPRCPDKLVAVVAAVAVAAVAAVAAAGAACEPSSAPAKAPRVLTIGCRPRAVFDPFNHAPGRA